MVLPVSRICSGEGGRGQYQKLTTHTQPLRVLSYQSLKSTRPPEQTHNLIYRNNLLQVHTSIGLTLSLERDTRGGRQVCVPPPALGLGRLNEGVKEGWIYTHDRVHNSVPKLLYLGTDGYTYIYLTHVYTEKRTEGYRTQRSHTVYEKNHNSYVTVCSQF